MNECNSFHGLTFVKKKKEQIPTKYWKIFIYPETYQTFSKSTTMKYLFKLHKEKKHDSITKLSVLDSLIKFKVYEQLCHGKI